MTAPDLLPRLEGEDLTTIHQVGSRQVKATNWMFWPSYTETEFESGRRVTLPKLPTEADDLAWIKERGAETEIYEIRSERRCWKLEHAYPEIPTYATEFQHNYGYENPTLIEKWQWTTTFQLVERLVTFADGWRGYQSPVKYAVQLSRSPAPVSLRLHPPEIDKPQPILQPQLIARTNSSDSSKKCIPSKR